MNKKNQFLCATAFLGVVQASPALAQADVTTHQTPAPERSVGAQSAENHADGDQDIVVTAQLREQSLQRVPAAITSLGGEALANLGATNLTTATALVSGLRITPLRQGTQIFMRGVGQTLTGINADPAIAVNVDGVYQPAEMSGTSFYDVERVEVVPGPQGTLYGRNATGGVINIITRRPGNVLAVDGFAEVGNYGRVQSEIAADLPLGDNFAVRAAFNLIRHDGYFSNGIDDQQTTSGRLTAVWKPTGRTEVTIIGAYNHDGGLGDVGQNIPYPTQGPRYFDFDPDALNLFNRSDVWYGNLTVNQELAQGVHLSFISGYNKVNLLQNSVAFTGPPLAGLRTELETRAISEELRLNVSTGRLEAVAGLYYFNIDSTSYGTVDYLGRSTRDGFVLNSDGEAAFGQLTYSVLDSLRLTAGIRYTEANRDMNGGALVTTAGVAAPFRPYIGKRTDNHLDYRAGIELDVAPASMLYASIASGFTPGGFSTAQIVPGQSPAVPFAPVTLTAYTVGTKNRFAANGITLNLEGFYYDYKNYTVSQRNPITGQNNVYNAEKAEVYGVQLDAAFRLSPRDNFSINATYLHAEATRLTTPLGNFDGFELPYAPTWSVSSSYSHTFELANGAHVVALANLNYASGRWGNYAHLPGTRISGHTNSNLNLTYEAPSGHWSLGAFVRNLENAVTPASGLVGAVPALAAYFLEPPRTFGGRFAFNF